MSSVTRQQSNDEYKVKYSKADLYSASTQTPLTRSDMDHTVLPANDTISVFTPSRRASLLFDRHSLRLPTEGWPG